MNFFFKNIVAAIFGAGVGGALGGVFLGGMIGGPLGALIGGIFGAFLGWGLGNIFWNQSLGINNECEKSLITVLTINHSSVEIDWTPKPNAKQYDVYYRVKNFWGYFITGYQHVGTFPPSVTNVLVNNIFMHKKYRAKVAYEKEDPGTKVTTTICLGEIDIY